MSVKELRVVQWNCQGLYPKLTRFKHFLYDNKPHIACLSETGLKPNREPKFVGYTSYFEHRLHTTGGGLLILVKNELSSYKKRLDPFRSGQLEVQSVVVLSNKGELQILNSYNPCKNISQHDFEQMVSKKMQ